LSKAKNTDYNLSFIKEFGEGDSFLLMLINLFLSSSKEDLELFEKAFKEEDWNEVGSIAHRMRSRAQHFKMSGLVKMLQEIENQCANLKFTKDFKNRASAMINYYFEIIDLLTQESLILIKSKGG